MKNVAFGLGIFLVTFTASMALTAFVLVKLPPDYLIREDASFLSDKPEWLRLLARVGKNLLGVLLVLGGIVMSLPGVPGQGILTILIGIMLLDFPGKRKLERKIIASPKVWSAINKLRARFHKEPLIAN